MPLQIHHFTLPGGRGRGRRGEERKGRERREGGEKVGRIKKNIPDIPK